MDEIPAWWLPDNGKFIFPQDTIVFSGKITRKAEFQRLKHKANVKCVRKNGVFLMDGVACVSFVQEGKELPYYYVSISAKVKLLEETN